MSFGAIRALLGALVLVRTTPLSRLLPWQVSHVPAPLLGWPEHGIRAPWLGSGMPAGIVMALCVLRTASAAAFMLGWRPVVSGAVVAGSAFAVMSQDAFSFKYTLYTLFMGVALVAAQSRWLVQMFVASVYFWAGVAKVHLAWLSGETLRKLHDAGYFFGWLGDAACETPLRCRLAAWAIVGVEIALGPLLLARPTRRVAIALAFAMHAAYEWAARPDVFGWVMLVLLAAFVDQTRTPQASGNTQP